MELLQITTNAGPETIRSLRQVVRAMLEQAGVTPERAAEVELCVHEALANVARHGYHGSPGRVSLVATKQGSELELVVRDEGRGIVTGIDEGLGLRIVRELAGRYTVAPGLKGGTELTMRFPLQ